MKMMGKRWRDFKSDLKRKYRRKYKTNYEEMLQDRDRGVLEDQWPGLVAHWSSRKAKKISKRNRRSRKKQKMVNASGRKSHARVRDEIETNTGKEPSKYDVFLITRKKKNGDLVDDATAEVMTKLNALLDQEPEELRSDCHVRNKIFDKVMGPEKPGRVRTFGPGPTPKQVFGLSSKMTSETSSKPIEDIVRERIQETLTADYLETMREEICQGINLEELREEVRANLHGTIQLEVNEEMRGELKEKLREEIGPEVCEEIVQDLRLKIRQELRGEMEGMMRDMKSSWFDQMRHDNIQKYTYESRSVPSNKKQAPDASSAHRLASNDVIGLQQPLNKLQIDNKSLDRSHEIHKDKARKKKQNDEISKKLQLPKKKKNQNEDQNVYVKNEHGEVVVDLLDYKSPNTIVARGILISQDPYKIVGGMKLGLEYYAVLG